MGAEKSTQNLAPNVVIEIERSHNLTSNVSIVLAFIGVVTALLPITAIVINIFDEEALVYFHLSSAAAIILCVGLIMSVQKYHKNKVVRLLESLDIAWDEEEPLDLEWIMDLIESNRGGKLAKEIDEDTGAAMYITRGNDEKGPDWGRSDSEMSESMQRRDGIVEGKKYEGMEGELTKGEKTFEEANEISSIDAQERWERSESNDLELIESGLERLGDLVKDGHFERTAKDGALSELTETGSQDEIKQSSE